MNTDTVRQLTVAVSAVLGIVGAFIGSGAAGGTPIAEAAGGALSADATLIAPAGPAFAIWTAIYLGLLAYTVWQFLPTQRTDARERRLGYPIAASLLLNAAWILIVRAGAIWASVIIIVVLLGVLNQVFRTLRHLPARSIPAAIIVDGTMGLYLGWVCVATAANITAALVDSGFNGFGLRPEAWAVSLLVVIGVIGALLAWWGRGRLAPTAAIAWGLAWVAVGRLADQPESTATGITAIVVAVALVVLTVVLRMRSARGNEQAPRVV
jgi:hypothetical protein